MSLNDKSIRIVQIDLADDTKPGRAVIDRIIEIINAPNLPRIRARNGSATLVFRTNKPWMTVPYIVGASNNQRVFELATRDGVVRLTIDCDRERVDLPAYENPEHMPLTTAAELGQVVIEAAFGLGFTWASQVDDDLAVAKRVEKFKADVAAGRVKVRTPEEIAEDDLAARDAEAVRNTAGREYEPSDGPAAREILAARYRHAARQRKQTVAA